MCIGPFLHVAGERVEELAELFNWPKFPLLQFKI